ncbi:hypothetical protein EPI10_005138 [Gossypium australe]|uniref:Uncharacterized protein n=1 Tax=Gossypium australe TaxID=47621 RepID=A0A5B6WMH0_9ROSI|nr:hypothetical protein EPI10_005138 [Gossypium australe]
MPFRPNYPSEYSQQVQQPPPTESSSDFENLLNAYIVKNDTTLRNLENQIGQLTNEIPNKPQEHCKAVSLPSGKTLEPKVVEVQDEPVVAQDKEEVQPSVETHVSQKQDSRNLDEVNSKPISSDYLTPLSGVEKFPQKSCLVKAKIPPLPYPQRFQKQQ